MKPLTLPEKCPTCDLHLLATERHDRAQVDKQSVSLETKVWYVWCPHNRPRASYPQCLTRTGECKGDTLVQAVESWLGIAPRRRRTQAPIIALTRGARAKQGMKTGKHISDTKIYPLCACGGRIFVEGDTHCGGCPGRAVDYTRSGRESCGVLTMRRAAHG